MKRILVPLFLLVPMGAAAQDLPRLPDETMTLIGQARALAPEFSSDLLLRLADSRIVGEPAWKHQLINEAFEAGERAQLPYPKQGEETTDARASRAYWRNGLEALSLQTRSVEKMLELDVQRARVLFEEISTPEVPELNCQETGAPDLSAYYETARHVADRGFTAEQRARLDHIGFLKGLIERMQSPAHVTPAVKLIFTVDVTAEERQELVETFAAALPRIRNSARVFGAATFQLVPVSAPVQLPPGINGAPPLLEAPPGQLPPQIVAAASQLMPALRSYIVQNVSGARCSEDIRNGQLPTVVRDFNHLALALDPNALLYKPISPDEAEPARDAGTYERHFWWQSDRSKQVLDALKWLNHGNRNLPDDTRFFTPDERATPEWNTHFVDTLRLIEGWQQNEESSRDDWFGMVSEAYGLLAEKAPPGEPRDAVMARYRNFMETQYPLVSHNLWFTQLKNQWRSKDPWIVEQFVNSSNPVMSLYARVNKRIPE